MKLNFCTLFNSAYLSRGMVMYRSLLENCADFHLYVLAFDDACYEYLSSGKFNHLTVISLKEFEDPDLLKIKSTRSATEYCWTCTASTILYCIKKFDLRNCTYIDADMQFYADPVELVNEMGQNSVMITLHNYTKEYDQSRTSGKYCVQFVTFMNDEKGLKVLNWWRNACIEWCYARVEDGKFGDQKYLDDWTERFEGVHVLKQFGGGIAPWNVQQYTFSKVGNRIQGKEKSSGKTFEVVFFHFHGLKFYTNDIVSLTGEFYLIEDIVKELFFYPYVRKLMREKVLVKSAGYHFDPNGAVEPSPKPLMGPGFILKYYLYDLKQSLGNIFGRNLKRRIRHHYYYKTDDFNS